MTNSPAASVPLREIAPLGKCCVLLLVVSLIALVTTTQPIQCSFVAVFLFAGPHNWIEIRYFMTRLPPRWGKLRNYFVLSITGVVCLTLFWVMMSEIKPFRYNKAWGVAHSCWLTGTIVWIVALTLMRSRQNPRRDWSLAVPTGLLFVSFAWYAPRYLGLLIIYVHPLMALWILDRELIRSRSSWLGPYRVCLAILPFLILGFASQLSDSSVWWSNSPQSSQIRNNAGVSLLPNSYSQALIVLHVFLELLHYGVWLIAIPLVGFREAPWRIREVLLARRSSAWKKFVGTVLAFSAVMVIVLWNGFTVNYVTTRDLYFTLAIFHVLAEVPFLLRSL